MPYLQSFFVKGLAGNCAYWINSRLQAGVSKIESDERLFAVDLICEGPCEGLVDKNGYLLKYATSENSKDVDNIILGKGIYYNNIPLIDSKTNKFNFVNSGFDIDYGDEIKNINNSTYASTIYNYDQKLYLAEKMTYFNSSSAGLFEFSIDENDNIDLSWPMTESLGVNKLNFIDNYQITKQTLKSKIEEAKNICQEFNHKINNKYCDQVSIIFTINTLFGQGNGGDTLNSNTAFAIEISEDFSSKKYYCIVNIVGCARAPASIEVPIDLSLNSLNNNNYYIKVFSLAERIPVTSGNIFVDVNIGAIIERVKYRGNFYYPYSAIVRSLISSRHFSSDPSRSFDMKLLKIKVPSNYDAETKEYKGNWSGTFDPFLKWTDNPAWIFYDICTNSRYGIGNGNVYDKDLNKWELYKLSKYCDELVKVNVPYAYDVDEFTIQHDFQNKLIINKKNNISLEAFKLKYPPVKRATDAGQTIGSNDGFHNSIIFLFDLINIGDGLKLEKNYKKIIWDVQEIKFDGDGNKSYVADGTGSAFEITLLNDFGPKKFFETDPNELYNQFFQEHVRPPLSNLSVRERVAQNSRNSEWGAKHFILTEISNDQNNSTGKFDYLFTEELFDQNIFIVGSELGRSNNQDYSNYLRISNLSNPNSSSTFKGYSSIKGKCLPKKENYRDPLEPRFTCNLLIDNETNCLKILNDISSIFRGITYYKNNYITTTIDVSKPVSYIFNNTNVKEGFFNYATGSLEGLYTVAKVVYKDKFENFNDQVEIVEDNELIKNYGIIVKEILGFGITSKDQARRIGKWLLATNRFENQTVNFSTDLQGILLRPGDVIQVQDQYKNDSTLQGRVVSVNYDSNYIVVDRQLNLNLIGQKIKFIYDKKIISVSDLNSKETVSDADIDSLNNTQVIEMKILNIENNKNRVYFDKSYNYSFLNKIVSSAPFIISDVDKNKSDSLFKIIKISEVNNNEYTIFALKYDQSKYDYLDIDSFEKVENAVDNTIAYSNSDFIQEIEIPEFNAYLDVNLCSIAQIYNNSYDYALQEPVSTLIKSDTNNYCILNIDFSAIVNYITTQSVSSQYYKNIISVLQSGGGFITNLSVRNQNLKFALKYSDLSNKKVFLGKFAYNDLLFKSSAFIRIFLFDKNNKIININ